tara:strand:+ start:1096 stop:1455 length:360 start_codon:yes stop_codon:yes gene_type:complete
MTKLIFHILNIGFAILYIYPGSIFGFIIYRNFSKQPQITPDLIVSSNHVYAFSLLSLLGFINYYRSHKNLIISYFFLISILFEILHIFIPNRSFQFSDLFGNIIGVLFSLFLINIWRKK